MTGPRGHAVITGGSSGIGLAVACELARRGMTDISLMARDRDRLNAARRRVESVRAGVTARPFAVDVRDETAVATAMAEATETAGPPAILMTSAGIAEPGYFADLPGRAFRDAMEVNYFGTLHAVRAAVPAMRRAKTGRIVLVSSGAGLIGLFGYSAYGPSKFAVKGLGEALDAELRRDGVRVSVVFPPDTDTPQLAAENRAKPPETKRMTGTARVWSAEAVARCVVRDIERGRATITPGWEMTWLHRLGGLVSPLLQAYWARTAAPPQETQGQKR